MVDEILKYTNMGKQEIDDFFKSKGFEKLQAGNGCVELIKKHPTKSGFAIQVNGEGISEIESDKEKVFVGIYEIDNQFGIWPYQKIYKSFKDFLQNEKNI